MARWALLKNAEINPEAYYLGVVCSEAQNENRVLGHLSLQIQPLDLPGADGRIESFVNTFAVEADYRRRGFGRALQLEALRLSGDLHCYQMRSWSSLDHPENYALKLALGFSVVPSVYEIPSGEKI